MTCVTTNACVKSAKRETAVVRSVWLLIKATVQKWIDHKDAVQGAALAYYSVFSIGPLMVIAIAIAGFVFGQEAARGEVQGQLSGLVGQTAAAAIDSMLAGADGKSVV